MTNQPTNNQEPMEEAEESVALASAEHALESSAAEASEPASMNDFGEPFVADDPTEAAAEAPSGEKITRVRKKRKSHRKRRRIIRRVLIFLLVMAILACAGVVAYTMLHKTGEEALKVEYNEGSVLEYNGGTYKYNENVISLCFMGYDLNASADNGETNAQADAVMVLALDTETGKLTVIAIPRDTMVSVDHVVDGSLNSTTTMQLCLAYGLGNGGEDSAQNVVTSVQRILNNMPITYYFAMNESAVAPLNDAVGGITLTALQTIPQTDIVEGEETTLLGDRALKYVQWRDITQTNSSIDRQERQVQYVKAFAKQALSLATSAGGASVLSDLFSTASEYSNTNLGASEFTYLASVLMSKGVTDIDVVQLQGTMKQGDYYSEYYLDADATYQTVIDVFYQPVDTTDANSQS